MAERHGYGVEFAPVGDDDPEVGPPTQMAVFTQNDKNDASDKSSASDKNDKNVKEVRAA